MKFTKYIFLLIIATIAQLFVSCSKESDPTLDLKHSATSQTRSVEGSPCFDRDFFDCAVVVDEVDKIIDLPGYCPIKATYKIYRCPTGGITIYNLDLIHWDYTSDCQDYQFDLILGCYQDCFFQPDPPTCRIHCLSDAKRQLVMDLKKFIIDDYIINGPPNTNGEVGLCGQLPYLIQGLFFEDLCLQICYNDNAPPGQKVKHFVCGDGCCTHIRYYCKDSENNPPHVEFENYSSSGLNCGIIIVQCDEGYHKEGDCVPENCHP